MLNSSKKSVVFEFYHIALNEGFNLIKMNKRKHRSRICLASVLLDYSAFFI